ncbi:MAG: hypothetical protein KGY74_10865, partial [Candidatus Cloacimonetes bacterium]|nr:hypothetical protein [Candidatus Cloacimonadota bacterium]
MANVVGRLKAVLGLDDKKYRKGLNKAKKNSSKALSGLKKQALKVGGAIAGAFALKGIVRSVNQTAKFGDEMAKLSKQTGFTVEQLQKYRFAAERSGVSANKMNTVLQVFQKRLGELKAGTGSLHTRLKKLDPAFMQQLKATKDTNKAFRMYVNRVSQVSDKSTQAAFAQAAFSRTGIEMTRMMQGGTSAMDELGREAEETGGIISGKTAAASEKYVDQLTNMKMSIRGVKASLMETLMPAFQKAIKFFQRFAKWLKENRDTIERWVKIIGSAVGVLGAVRVAMIAFNAVLAANPIGLVITAIAGLIAAFRAAWKNSETFRNFFKKLWIRIKQYSAAAWDAVKTYFGSIGTVLRTIGKAISQVFKGQFKKAKKTIVSGFKGLVIGIANIGKEAKKRAQKELKELEEGIPNGTQKNIEKKLKEQGKKAGQAYADGVEEGSSGRMAAPDKGESKSMQPFQTTPVDSSQLASMDAAIKKTNQLQNEFTKSQQKGSMMGGVLSDVFDGMQNSISNALQNSENILEGFWKFFKDFIKGLIIKLVAAAAAAAALVALLSLTGLSLGGIGSGGFGAGNMKKAFGMLSGFGGGVGM